MMESCLRFGSGATITNGDNDIIAYVSLSLEASLATSENGNAKHTVVMPNLTLPPQPLKHLIVSAGGGFTQGTAVALIQYE